MSETKSSSVFSFDVFLKFRRMFFRFCSSIFFCSDISEWLFKIHEINEPLISLQFARKSFCLGYRALLFKYFRFISVLTCLRSTRRWEFKMPIPKNSPQSPNRIPLSTSGCSVTAIKNLLVSWRSTIRFPSSGANQRHGLSLSLTINFAN